MSRTIKVSDGVYIGLLGITEKKETFSQVIERLIKFYISIKDDPTIYSETVNISRLRSQDTG